MKETKQRIVTLIAGVLLCAGSASVAADAQGQKNIVFILADDLGWSDLGCYGSDLHETPHVDRLAREGVRFLQAYAAAPVCSPTRASILTGKFPARLHMTIWREAAAERGNRRLLEPITRSDLPLEELTLAEVLQTAGYYTAHVGKWHLGSAEYYPEAHGFDVNIGGTLWGAPQTFFYPFRGGAYFSGWRYVPGLEPGNEGDYLTDRLTDKALEIIDRVADRPFFLSLWYHSVHTPIEGKPELVEKFRGKVREAGVHTNHHYAAMVASLDENVGRILRRLDEKQLTQQTIVVFFSDNGGFVGPSRLQPGLPVTSNSPLRSGKGSLYEGGIRVPLIVRCPGVTRSGAVCDEPVISCDFFPTLLQLTGLSTNAVGAVDGVDIRPLLEDPSCQLAPRTLFFHYPHYYPTTTPVSAIRCGAWKLLEYYEDQHVELYNLGADPGEQNDLADQERAKAQVLRDALHRWRSDVQAQEPVRNTAAHAPKE